MVEITLDNRELLAELKDHLSPELLSQVAAQLKPGEEVADNNQNHNNWRRLEGISKPEELQRL